MADPTEYFDELPVGVHADHGKSTPKEKIKWVSKGEIPAIGSRVRITFNGFGEGIVIKYFREGHLSEGSGGYLGVCVKVDNPPKWWLHQNRDDPNRLVHAFGPEIEII